MYTVNVHNIPSLHKKVEAFSRTEARPHYVILCVQQLLYFSLNPVTLIPVSNNDSLQSRLFHIRLRKLHFHAPCGLYNDKLRALYTVYKFTNGVPSNYTKKRAENEADG